ncbi:phage shock protein operon transcriptional activator, partial [Escherichia marmotae]|nr:phage shock protein operon transcriptional activator [Escherichia marmotae]
EGEATPSAPYQADAAPPPPTPSAAAAPSATDDLRGAVNAYEKILLEEALGRHRFNQRATAAALGLSYDQLRHAMKRHKLQD